MKQELIMKQGLIEETIRSTRDPCLLLATLLLNSINNLLNMLKNPRLVPFFLYDNAFRHLENNNFDEFWRELKTGIKDARREINGLSADVSIWQWDNFDAWFMERTSRFDELQAFDHSVYGLFLGGLDEAPDDCRYGSPYRTWLTHHSLTDCARKSTLGYTLEYLKMTLGNKVITAQKNYSIIDIRSNVGNTGRRRRFYVVNLDDVIKRPDETISDVLDSKKLLWRKPGYYHYKLHGLFWFLDLAANGF
ncbi:hypothetical protein PFJ87_08g02190 [Encephalitozoon hellem]|uniref:Uncharacterized protein n=1 Tax=Encephalitozoon hellem TaxID=27973 RepID=A0ABY8CLR7_ENCHE|nr:hypothetical protein PFJ87_08g02190 [Encephalitozoon hellem]